jgi:hypothetical protein
VFKDEDQFASGDPKGSVDADGPVKAALGRKSVPEAIAAAAQ